MTDKVRAVELAIGALVILLVFGAYLHSREVSVRADAEHQANQTLQKQLGDMKADFDRQIADRDAKYREDTKDLTEKFNGSMQQVMGLISQRASLPVPITVTTPAPTKDNPNPTPIVNIPQQDFPAAKAYVQDCEQCKLDRDKAQADLADRVRQGELAQRQIDSLKKDNGDLVKAAHGTFFGNLKRSAKWIFWGAVGGAAVLCGSGHCK